MSLGAVKHQGFAQRYFHRAWSEHRLAHALLFHGPDGVGKELFARGVAEVLLCPRSAESPVDGQTAETLGCETLLAGCGQCDDCAAVARNTHPDLHIVYRQLHREHPDPTVRSRKGLELGIDVVRHFLIERVGLTPQRGRYKVFIVRDADRITLQAQNSLLKTLEEPPGATVLMLLAASLDRLLPTVLSRCQSVPFDALPAPFIRQVLGQTHPDLPNAALDWYTRQANGSLGLATREVAEDRFALGQRIAVSLAEVVSPSVQGVGELWTASAKTLAESYRKQDPDISDTEATRRGLKIVLQLAANGFADRLRMALETPTRRDEAVHAGRKGLTEGSAGPAQCAHAIDVLVRAERQLDLNAYAPLVMDTLLASLAGLGTSAKGSRD